MSTSLISMLAERSGTLLAENEYWGASPLAFVENNAVHFQHVDWLGTERITTSYSGATEGSYSSLPFGDGFVVNGADQDPYHFAVLDHDYESGQDHAQFREYSDAQGRWNSPDPYDGSYDFTDPQSFNRYSYVGNNPLSFTDPTGQFAPIVPPAVCAGGPEVCAIGIAVDVAELAIGYGIVKGLEDLFGFGGPTFHGSLKPRPNAQPWDEYNIHYGPNIAGALGLPDESCEFGACGAGPSSFGPGGPSGGSNPLEVTSTAISFSGIWAVIGGLTGPATTVSYDPKNHLLCGGLGWGVSGGHNFSIGPVVIHAKPGNTSEDVLGGESWSGGWNITPWWGVQGSTNSSGYTAGYSYGVPGISGAWTHSGCKHVGG